MSNKFRNILSQAVLILAFLLPCSNLLAFDPAESNFQTQYQFELYKSWLARGHFKTNFPASFYKEKIVKTFLDENGRSVLVEYDWEDHRIAAQRETAGYLFFAGNAHRIWAIIKYIEGFIYRLNTQNQQFLLDYVDFSKMEINYLGLTGRQALDKLWNDFDRERVRFRPLEIDQTESSLIFSLIPFKGNTIKLEFPLDFDLQEEFAKITKLEKEISAKAVIEEYSIAESDDSYQQETEISAEEMVSEETVVSLENLKTEEAEVVKDESEAQEPEELVSSYILPPSTFVEKPEDFPARKPLVKDYADLPKISDLNLADYIKYYISKKQNRELINNKVSDPLAFLKQEFPGWEFTAKDDICRITHPPLRDEFHCDLKVKFEIKKDGVEILPASDDYYFLGKYMIFSGTEKIDLRNLSEVEIEQIAPFIPQLVYEHRSLGSNLLNFLLIHDDVPTTLIVQNDERKLFELDSYADLLLLLNNYWQTRTVYFSILDVKKVNGFIEFQSYLIAYDAENQISDIADIQFHLDNKYRIDLIMMILHPNAEF